MEAEEIIKRRKELELTKIDLAQKVEVTPKTVDLWERGITTPNEENQKKLKEVLS